MNRFESRWFKPVVAVAMGLASFAANWFAPQIYEEGGLALNFLVGLVFPLIVALAWGWRWGLVSSLAGGSQWVWWLWPEDGWANVYSFGIFTLWVVWHGWCAERKRMEDRWYFSPFAVEAPFRVVSEVGFLTLYVWLLSLNPPPWDAGATITTVERDWLVANAGKHVVEGYLLVLAAYIVLGLGPVRKFFGLEQKPSQCDITTIFSTGILLTVALWFADNVAHYSSQHGEAKHLLEALTFHPTDADLVTRILFTAVMLAATAAFARFMQQRAKLKNILDHQNRVLLAIRNVNQLITRERNRQSLLDQACSMLVETRGYFNVWIALLESPVKLGEPLPQTFRIVELHRAGFDGDAFLPMIALFESGQLPQCARAALGVSDVHILLNPSMECINCPFADKYQGGSGFVARLESGGKIYGWLSASLPSQFAADPQEKELMREISGDIAFAIESMETAESLEDTRRREEAAVRAGGVGVWDWDLKTGRVFYSSQWKRQIGFGDDEIGDSLDEWESRVHPDDLQTTKAAIHEHIEHCSNSYAQEFRFRHKDGSYRDILANASVLSSEGGATRVLGTHVDVTDIKLKSRLLEEAIRDAEAANRAKSMFLATMSHELRTPLTPILGFSQFLLADENLTPDQVEALEIIHRRGNDLLSLISDLLNFSKLDANVIRMNPEAVAVGPAIDEAAAPFAQEAARKGISITTTVDPQLAQPLLLDPSRLRQILQNLIGNAVKFIESGTIHLSADIEQGTLLLSVADTGPGISQDDIEKVFDLFYQADSSTTRSHGGAGLGLSICKRLVTAMGGDIHVESTPGKGTTFRVAIPAQPTPDAPSTRQARLLPPVAPPSRQSIRILVAEDDDANALVTQKMLERAGHVVKRVANGFDAVAAIDACGAGQFDLILMDLKMPVMDGLEAASKLRERGVRTPILALTACAYEQDRVACLAAGINDWFTKPVDWKLLNAWIEKHVAVPSPQNEERT